jgi:hypothetical protein
MKRKQKLWSPKPFHAKRKIEEDQTRAAGAVSKHATNSVMLSCKKGTYQSGLLVKKLKNKIVYYKKKLSVDT